jgi:hypothetical protein
VSLTPFYLENRVGRLVELRPEGLHSLADLASIFSAIGQLRRASPGPSIYCVDWRRLRVLSPEVAQTLAESMRDGNSHTLRSAALTGAHATLGLQLDRLIRETNHPSRRIFRDPAPMLAWLAQVTTPEEQARAQQFLESFEPPSSQLPLSRAPEKVRPGS